MSKVVVAGVDLGASESYVAYVGKGVVDIVQNEVSKRATPSTVGFNDRERLLGDAALALIRSNAKNTCRNFKHLLGRKVEAPDVQIEHFWSTAKLVQCADGHAGYEVSYKGETRQMSAVEITAMYLTQLREITEKWCEGKVTDIVVAVPSSYADVQRQAVLDAAKIANIKVLRVINEHTATALAYGIYRSNDFDAEKPLTVAFCSMGNSIFSVSIVQFVRGKLKVVAERSDKVGGRELDECLMRAFAAQFDKKHGCDPLSTKKAAFKLEDAVMKTKKVLSANSEAPVNCECLMEDHDFASQMTRADLETMCEPARRRVKAVLESALQASGLTAEQVDSIEIVGGGSRVPWVKKVCSEAFGGKELSTTMNQEESVARGCALQAAILSPLYKVRDFKVEDSTAFAINVGWIGGAAPPEAMKEEDGDASMADVEGEYKSSAVFPAGSPMGVAKTLTFYRRGPFELRAEYADPTQLLPMTPKDLGTFQIEAPTQEMPKKIKVKTKLTLHGTFVVEGAQLIEEEEYEEVVKEKRELPPDDFQEEAEEEEQASPKEDNEGPGKAGDKSNGENGHNGDDKENNGDKVEDQNAEKEGNEDKDEKKEDKEEKIEETNGEKKPKQGIKRKLEQEKKYEWVEVKKMKKRIKKTDLKVTATGTPGLSEAEVQRLMDAESAMQAEMREIVDTDAKRNDLESYIFNTRAKISVGDEHGPFISDADREAFLAELTKAEDWLYDTMDATKVMFMDKLADLKATGDPVAWRCKEAGMRAEWIKAVAGTIGNYRTVAETPGDKFGHIAAEKLGRIAAACDELEAWLKEMREKQDNQPKYEHPVLLCADMERKNQDLARMADEILKEKKPDPPPAEESAKEEENDEEEVAEQDTEQEGVTKEEGAPSPEAEKQPDEKDMEVEAPSNDENMEVDA